MGCGNNCAGCDCADTPAGSEVPQQAALTFQQELEHLINKHSQENGSNTPDFLLARFLGLSLAAFNHTVMAREQWYGRSSTPITGVDTEPDPEAVKRLNVVRDRYMGSTAHNDMERALMVAAVDDCITALTYPSVTVAATPPQPPAG